MSCSPSPPIASSRVSTKSCSSRSSPPRPRNPKLPPRVLETMTPQPLDHLLFAQSSSSSTSSRPLSSRSNAHSSSSTPCSTRRHRPNTHPVRRRARDVLRRVERLRASLRRYSRVVQDILREAEQTRLSLLSHSLARTSIFSIHAPQTSRRRSRRARVPIDRRATDSDGFARATTGTTGSSSSSMRSINPLRCSSEGRFPAVRALFFGESPAL